MNNLSYIPKKAPVFKKHFSWAIKHSLLYCEVLINREGFREYNFKSLFTETFLEKVTNFSEFTNLTKGYDEYIDLLFSSLAIEQINSEPEGGYEVNHSHQKLDVDINKKLHKLLFEFVLDITSNSDATEFYQRLLKKGTTVTKSEGIMRTSTEQHLIDSGAIMLLTSKNTMHLEKLSLCEHGEVLKQFLDFKIIDN
ncbi:hypothetical protein P4S65_08675 [Pseudoalteromonas sp. B131b]|uniref:hypothetical protein n=1 Tax=Pseudoalteromonas sp. B131b TaxID=630493 RepID=UPI00301D1283